VLVKPTLHHLMIEVVRAGYQCLENALVMDRLRESVIIREMIAQIGVEGVIKA
jgi:hypothetical protein